MTGTIAASCAQRTAPSAARGRSASITAMPTSAALGTSAKAIMTPAVSTARLAMTSTVPAASRGSLDFLEAGRARVTGEFGGRRGRHQRRRLAGSQGDLVVAARTMAGEHGEERRQGSVQYLHSHHVPRRQDRRVRLPAERKRAAESGQLLDEEASTVSRERAGNGARHIVPLPLSSIQQSKGRDSPRC